MWTAKTWLRTASVCAAVGVPLFLSALLAAALGSEAEAAAAEAPVAGKQVHFPDGTWSALPQTGPDGKVTQCVLVAPRARAGPSGPNPTALSLIIGRGAGLTFVITDGKVPSDDILDDESEVVLNSRSFPADAFTVGANSLALHPGDAARRAVHSRTDDRAAIAFGRRRRRHRSDHARSAWRRARLARPMRQTVRYRHRSPAGDSGRRAGWARRPGQQMENQRLGCVRTARWRG